MPKRPNAQERKHYARMVEDGCLICGRPAEIHHSLLHLPRRNDRIFPLCPNHHRNTRDSVHQDGNERRFFARHGINAETWPVKAWDETLAILERKL